MTADVPIPFPTDELGQIIEADAFVLGWLSNAYPEEAQRALDAYLQLVAAVR